MPFAKNHASRCVTDASRHTLEIRPSGESACRIALYVTLRHRASRNLGRKTTHSWERHSVPCARAQGGTRTLRSTCPLACGPRR